MAASLSTVAAKDGAGTTIAAGLQALDNSGAGTGPFTLGQVLIAPTGALAAYGSGVNGTTVLRVSLATDSAGAGVAQGSTTSGQLGALLAAATSKTAGSFTHGQTNTVIADPAGNLFVIGGGMGIITRSHVIAASDGAQTNAALLTISTGSKIVITQISAKMDAANSVNVAVKIGFGTATIPAASLAGTAAILLEGQFAGGCGQQVGNGTGILGVGADNEDLRITSDSPTGGNIRVTYSYYTVAS